MNRRTLFGLIGGFFGSLFLPNETQAMPKIEVKEFDGPRKVYCIDVSNMSPKQAEMFIDRLKVALKERKR
jgi:hypothetical protein